jgi:toxin-antitoxin system PIN domain toxin
MVDLLDASVWVPLSAPDHVHHARAHRYWQIEAADQLAFCRVTALAFLRYLTNRHIMRHAVLTGREAWIAYERWLALPEIVFLADPAGIDDQLRRVSHSADPRAAQWTDAYLAAVAIAGGLRLVAFDTDFSRFADLDLLQLTA